MSQMLDVTYSVQHGEDTLNQHAHVPCASLTHLHVSGVSLLGVEAVVGQHHHLLLELLYHRLESRVVYVGGVVVPLTHQTPLVEHHSQLGTHYPPAVALAL